MKFILTSFIIISLFTGCASLTPHPKSWTSVEKKAAVFNVCGIIADAYTTEQMLNNPDNRELMPTMSEHPSDSQLIVDFSLSAIITLGLAHYYPELRERLLFGYGGWSFGLAVHNQNVD